VAKPGVWPARHKRACKTQGLLDQSSPQFFNWRRDDTGGFKARIHVVKLQRTEWRWGMPILTDSGPLSDREEKVGLTMLTHMCTYHENLVKIGAVHSKIIALQGDR